MLHGSSTAPALFGVYLSYASYFALAPFTFHRDADISLGGILALRFEGLSSVWRLTPWDFWTNVLFFLPFGFLFVLLPFIVHVRPLAKMCLATVCAGFLSLGIELGQMFLPRHPSLVDIACNVLGAGVGSVLGVLAYSARPHLKERAGRRLSTGALPGLLMMGYWAALCVLFSLPLPLVPDFSNWDSELRLYLGNETVLSRPWQGELYGVAIYDRALSPEEVRTHFIAGPAFGASATCSPRGIVVRYDFSEGSGSRIHDRAPSKRPVNLLIGDPSLVRWLRPNGLSILGPTTIFSDIDSTGSLYERLSVQSQMSLESWVAPAAYGHAGPDPFLSSSNGVDLRNFALAQEERDLVFWLRTPLSGVNARNGELRTVHHPLTAGLHHVVVTYASSIAVLYLNGMEQARRVLEVKIALLDRLVDTIGPYYEHGVRSAFLFPLGVLSYLSLRRRKSTWMPYAFALVGAGTLDMVRALSLKQPAEASLVAVSAGTVLVAGIAATRLFATDPRHTSCRK
jgi:hypothetical protein